jgi:hypothetical protein
MSLPNPSSNTGQHRKFACMVLVFLAQLTVLGALGGLQLKLCLGRHVGGGVVGRFRGGVVESGLSRAARADVLRRSLDRRSSR